MAAGRARAGALLLVGLVLAAACGSSGDDRGVGTPSTTAPTVPATDAAGQPVPGSAAPVPGEPSPGGADDPEVPSAPQAPPSTAAPEPGATADPVTAGPVGSFGPRYLRAEASERVLVQVLAQDGAAPQAAVPERIRQVLAGLNGKPVSLAAAAVEGGARAWTSDQLQSLADAASPPQTPQQAVLTLLFLRGGFAENERAVGVAVRGDVAAVFAERVTEAAGVFGDRDAVEDAVALHEVGHLLGLVDLVVDTGRADPEHPGHSPNRGSVMYYAVESTLLGSILEGGPPRDFDQDDLAELARIRNG